MTWGKNYPIRCFEDLYVLGCDDFPHYLVMGETGALIEAGISASAHMVGEQIRGLPVASEQVRYIVVLHGHYDHVCGLPLFKEVFPQARVLSSAYTARVLKKKGVVESFFAQDVFTSNWLLHKMGGPAQCTGFGTAGVCPAERLASPSSLPEPDLILNDGDELDLGAGCRIRFLAAPGHSPCGLAAYLPGPDTLLVSDSLGFYLGKGDIFPLFFQSYDEYVETIKKLHHVQPEQLGLGHGTMISGRGKVDETFRAAEEAAVRLYREIHAKLRVGGNPEELARSLYSRFYRGGLTMYTEQNIYECAKLLIRRSQEELPAL